MFLFSKESAFQTQVVIVEELKLVIEVLSGTMSLLAIEKYKSNLAADAHFNSNYNLITILDSLLIDVLLTEVEDYVNFLKGRKDIVGERKVAIVSATPNQAIYSSIFKSLNADLSQQVSVFSNLDDAISFLNETKSKDEIHRLVSNAYNSTKRNW